MQMAKIKELKELYSKVVLDKRIAELGKQISEDYKGKDLLCVCVLKGAVFFFTDLVRAIDNPQLKIDFIRASSYGDGTASSHEVKLLKDLDLEIKGKNLLFIEDIIDSGITMKAVTQMYRDRGAASVKLCALFDQRSRREVEVKIDYAGFVLNKGFLVGYGLDLAEIYRNLPNVYEVIFE